MREYKEMFHQVSALTHMGFELEMKEYKGIGEETI